MSKDKDALQLMNTAFSEWSKNIGWNPQESRLTYYKLAWIIKSITPDTSWLLAIAEALQIKSLDNLRQLANRKITTYVVDRGPNSYEAPIPEGVLLRSRKIWDAWLARYPKNPITYLKNKGFYTDLMTCVKTAKGYKLTVRSTQVMGQDTVNILTAYLKPAYTVREWKQRSTPLPNIILCDLDSIITESKKIKHWLTLYLGEN